jgi:hypothetical protein
MFGKRLVPRNPMSRSIDHLCDSVVDLPVSRRRCLHLFMSWAGLCLFLPCMATRAIAQTHGRSVLEQFLGEELTYQIGFWLFPRCGEARTRFSETGRPGIYRASLEGRPTGIFDRLLGRYRYSYVSYLDLSPAGSRLRPLRFQLIKRRLGKKFQLDVTFDHSSKKITFSQMANDGKREEEKVSMKDGIIYEDYLTLFYNFRHGLYGPLERGRTYHLPLHIHKEMASIDLSIAPRGEEEEHREGESNKVGKDFFLRFQVNREDVSSTSGKIEGWLSHEAVPVKGTIKDVILFGDLWGELIHRKAALAAQPE